MTPAELRYWRTEMGLTQKDAAAQLGVKPITYKCWELGHNPVMNTAALLAELLLKMARARRRIEAKRLRSAVGS